MKGKQLALLLVLVVVLGGAWYFLSERNRASWSETGGAGGKVVEFPINDVARLTIKSSAGEVNLVRKDAGWTVQERADYPANFEQVSDLLRKLWDLKTVQEVKAGPSQLPRLELVEPGQGASAGTLIEFKDKDGKTLNALLLGKKHMRKSEGGPHDFGGGFPTGRYVKTLAGAKISLVSESLDNVEPKPESWLQKDFLKIENAKSIAVAGVTDAQRWSVTRDSATAEWKLADAKGDEKLDTAKASPLSSVFAAPSFNDVLAADAKPEDTGLDKPTVATIETFDGFRYELKIGKANGENYPALIAVSANFPKERAPGKDEKPEDKTKLDDEFKAKQKTLEEKLAKEKKFEGRPYLVPKFAVEPLLKERAGLLPDKPAETPAAPGAPTTPATPPTSVTPPTPRKPVTVTTPPVTAPMPAPKVEAVTPPVKVEAVTPPVKVEAVTPPVQAPPLPPLPPTPPKDSPPLPQVPPKEAPPAPPKEAPPAPAKETPPPAPEPAPKPDPAPQPDSAPKPQ